MSCSVPPREEARSKRRLFMILFGGIAEPASRSEQNIPTAKARDQGTGAYKDRRINIPSEKRAIGKHEKRVEFDGKQARRRRS